MVLVEIVEPWRWKDGGDIDRLMRERDALRAEVERLATLVADMWLNADNWSGPNASSHYRSDISFRVRSALQPTKDGAFRSGSPPPPPPCLEDPLKDLGTSAPAPAPAPAPEKFADVCTTNRGGPNETRRTALRLAAHLNPPIDPRTALAALTRGTVAIRSFADRERIAIAAKELGLTLPASPMATTSAPRASDNRSR